MSTQFETRESLAVPEIFTTFTTRTGGHSDGAYRGCNVGHHVGDAPETVAANRAEVARQVGLPADRLVWLDQVHGTRVAQVERAPRSPLPETDAVVTATPELALAVLVADCVPVLLGDPVAGVVGAAHAGRMGAVAGIVPETLAAMERLGAQLQRIEAVLGPAICGGCYEVPDGMREAVAERLPGSATKTHQGTAGIDLRAGLARQLQEAGIASLRQDPRCTAEDPALYSFRRDGITGRQAGLVWLRQ